MNPTVMRSLGAVALLAPKTESGTIMGAAKAVAAAALVRLTKVRRVTGRAVFIVVMGGSGSCRRTASRDRKLATEHSFVPSHPDPPHETPGTSNIQHPTPNIQRTSEVSSSSAFDVGCWMFSIGSGVPCAKFFGEFSPSR